MAEQPETRNEEPTPVSVLEALWRAIKDHYPMLEYVGAYDDTWLEEFRPRVAAAKDLHAAYPILEELVCRLRDYHTRFHWPGMPDRTTPPVALQAVSEAGRTAVLVRKTATPLLKAGEEVARVNGVPVEKALEAAYRYAVGSGPGQLARSACYRMLLARRDTEVVLSVRSTRDDTARDVILKATGYPDTEPLVSGRELDKDTAYIRIPRWSERNGERLPALFDAALEIYRNHPYLILDVRDNGGGDDHLADLVTGRFLSQKVVSSISFHREVPTLQFTRTVEWCEPRGPWRYEGRLVVLTDEGCMSACEHSVSGLLAAGACLVGTPTSGACGWIRQIELPGGATLACSRTFPLHGLLPSPRLGIEPHILVPLTRKDLLTGRDAALDEARKWLRSGKPRPTRVQPLPI